MNKNATVLIVDDSAFDRALLSKSLAKKANLQILEASNSEECFNVLNTRKVDLVLMDIMMPGTSGDDTLVKIREKHNEVELPIIMVTSKSDSPDIVSCLQRGANDYITKPINFEVALSRISIHLKLSELSQQMIKLQEIAALDAMIATYNHEINNPLTIAIAHLESSAWGSKEIQDKLREALWRIADIVKKIKQVTTKKDIEYQAYAGKDKILQLKK